VLIVLDKALGISFGAFFREFATLLRRGPVTRAKSNAILIIILGAICAFYFFVEPVRGLLSLVNAVQSRAGDNDAYVLIGCLLVIGISGLLSVRFS
jgi:hypothetical protein